MITLFFGVCGKPCLFGFLHWGWWAVVVFGERGPEGAGGLTFSLVLEQRGQARQVGEDDNRGEKNWSQNNSGGRVMPSCEQEAVNPADFWEQSLARLRDSIPSVQYATWIRPLKVALRDGVLYLYAPNAVIRDWVASHYQDQILGAVQTEFPDMCSQLKFRVGSCPDDAPVSVVPAAVLDQAVVSSSVRAAGRDARPSFMSSAAPRLNKQYTFDQFVQGESNNLACEGAKKLVECCGRSDQNPFFICGGVGLGKTHMMHAIGHAIRERYPEKRLVCCTTEDFVADMVRCIREHSMEDFKGYYRKTDVLLIDDVQFFLSKERSQEEAYHTIDHVRDSGGQIVLTSDCCPNDMTGLNVRLRSRFNWGLTVAIEKPELEMRAAILLKKAEALDCPVGERIALFIASQVSTNVRDLEGALNRVVATARLSGKEIDENMVRGAMRDAFAENNHRLSIAHIKKVVSKYYGIRLGDLSSARRTRSHVRPRQVAMFLARELTQHSYPEIGNEFGGRDHTTVIHACRSIERLRRENEVLRADCDRLFGALRA